MTGSRANCSGYSSGVKVHETGRVEPSLTYPSCGVYNNGFTIVVTIFSRVRTQGGSDVRRTILFCVVLCLTASATASAEPICIVGDHFFQPDEIGTIALLVSGDVAVEGLNFYIQIDDGGAINGGSGTKPKIMDVDIVGPARSGLGPATLFFGNNTGQTNTLTSDLLWAADVTTASGTVNTAGTLAFVTIDTAGTAPGEIYPLLLKETAAGIFGAPGVDTDFAGIPANITNGSIRIIPEPSTILLLGSLLMLLPVLGRWR